jgi:hypothetical protein
VGYALGESLQLKWVRGVSPEEFQKNEVIPLPSSIDRAGNFLAFRNSQQVKPMKTSSRDPKTAATAIVATFLLAFDVAVVMLVPVIIDGIVEQKVRSRIAQSLCRTVTNHENVCAECKILFGIDEVVVLDLRAGGLGLTKCTTISAIEREGETCAIKTIWCRLQSQCP